MDSNLYVLLIKFSEMTFRHQNTSLESYLIKSNYEINLIRIVFMQKYYSIRIAGLNGLACLAFLFGS